MEPGVAVSIQQWLLAAETRQRGLGEVLEGLAGALADAGLRVARVRTSVTTKHPELFSQVVGWRDGRGIEYAEGRRDLIQSARLLDSPVYRVLHGAARVRCRLIGPDADLSFPITQELAAEGLTDYVVFALVFGTGDRTFLSFASAAPDGFSDADLALLAALVPALSVRVEVDATRHAMSSLLHVYLGGNAAAHVLAGAFVRGSGQPIPAAVWFCDMAGFTELADHRPAAEVVAILDAFFEAVAGPIAPRGGEVLKFIGDAVLAIFPVGEAGCADACRRALAAAQDALAGVRALSAREGMPPLGLGIALHLGEVLYGNIGARDRLDFTVIGAVVNEVCRVEPLCRSLGPILLTAEFAAASGVPVVRCGTHRLKGVSAPREVFAPAP
jgi:adenylate cyclase